MKKLLPFSVLGVLGGAYWCAALAASDSYYSVYILTAAAGLACCGLAFFRGLRLGALPPYARHLTRLFALGFSGLVYLANGPLFDPVTGTVRPATPTLFLLALVFLWGGYFVFRSILLVVAFRARRPGLPFRREYKTGDTRLFFAVWLSLAAVYALVLYLCYYPGVTTYDSINQLEQILGYSPYSNHHPYYHTRLVGLLFRLGAGLFGTPDGALGLYSLFSVLAMSAVFAYSVLTLCQATRSRWLYRTLWGFYLLMPYHILYSFALWKDVFFGAAVTGFVLSFFRWANAMGSPRRNRIAMAVFGLLMCLLRSNGLFAFALSLAVFLALFWKEQRQMSLVLCAVCVCGYVLTGPVLKALGIPQPRITESLSIPLQQVAQVVKDDCPLTPEQTALLEQCVDLEAVKEDFLPYISDPVKTLVDSSGFGERAGDYLKMYVQIGLRYPLKYIQAWVNQTKGYWNGGYGYWRFPAPFPNDLGISVTPPNAAAKDLFVRYERLFETTPVLQPLLSIGLFVWLLVLCGFTALQKKDKVLFFLVVPFLAVICSLLIATPVYSEFRYSYSVFCGGPLIFGLTLYRLFWKARYGAVAK